jgi:predicted nucleic acid-binding protein
VLLDDRAARRIAASFGIPVIGVLGTLVLLKRAVKIDGVRPLAEQLVVSGYYLSTSVIADACRQAGEAL